MKRLLAFPAFLLAFIPLAAIGGTDITAVPEPGTFELLALGGVVALVIGIRNRRSARKSQKRVEE